MNWWKSISLQQTSRLVCPILYSANVVPTFYEALCACATLNPDPHAAEDDIFDENHQWITADNFDDAEDGDEEMEGNVSKWRRTE